METKLLSKFDYVTLMEDNNNIHHLRYRDRRSGIHVIVQLRKLLHLV